MGIGLLVLSSCIAVTADVGKNFYDVPFRTMPGEAREVLSEAGFWNANFRPYDAVAAAELWTDSQVVRDVKGAAARRGERATAIGFACDERGFNVYVACGQVAPRFEFYLMTGTAGDNRVRPYYQMYFDGTELKEYPWRTASRYFRELKPYTKVEEVNVTDRDTLVRISYDWEGMWDYLPFDEADRTWRMSVIHWAPGGGRTWGGKVHETSAAGYVRFPAFTDEQKAAIMKHVLRAAVRAFERTQKTYFYNPGDGAPYVSANTNAYHLAEIARNPRSYVCYAEDPAFRPTLVELVKTCREKAVRVDGFLDLPPTEQAAFYAEAAPLLFNFKADVEEAYAALEERRFKARACGKELKAETAEGERVKDRTFYKWNQEYCGDLDLDKVPAQLEALDKEAATASSPAKRARARFDSAKLRFRAAVDDEPLRHLEEMEAAALDDGVPCETAFEMLYELRHFRRDAWKLFDDDFDLSRVAWRRLTRDAASADDPFLHLAYWKIVADWAASPYFSDKRTRNNLMSREHSPECMVEVCDAALADPVVKSALSAAGRPKEAQARLERECYSFAARKAKALYDLVQYDEAALVYEAAAKEFPFAARTARADLAAHYRKAAVRYYDRPNRELMMKAFELTDSFGKRLEIAMEMEDWTLAGEVVAAAEAAKKPVSAALKADVAFGSGDYAGAARLYAKRRPGENWPVERLWRAAQAHYAAGDNGMAVAMLEELAPRVRKADKVRVRAALARLKAK